MKRKIITNSETVNNFMDFVPLGQVFVMDALHKLAEAVLRDKENLRKTMKNSMINPDAWIYTAEEWQRLYGEQRKAND